MKFHNNKKNQRFFCPSFFPKTRKANISVTILVISVFLLCALALVSFITFKSKVIDIISGVVLVEKMNSQIEDYSFHDDLSRVDTNVNDQGKTVFYQERKGYSGFWLFKKEKIIFSLEYPVK